MSRSKTISPGEEFVASAYLCWSLLREGLDHELPRRLASPPLTSQAVLVLSFLSRLQPQPIGEIARFLGVSDAAASKLIEKMVRVRWLRRAQSVPDRRVWKVCLTAASARLLRTYERALEAGM